MPTIFIMPGTEFEFQLPINADPATVKVERISLPENGDPKMGTIPFTQYLLPNGRRQQIEIEMDKSLSDAADALIKKGYRFECEILTTGHISITCVDPTDSGDIAIAICENGPEVPATVEKVVKQAVEFDETGVVSDS